jgi:hypothetical protein
MEVTMHTRRQFILKGAAVVAAGAAVSGPTILVRRAAAADNSLKILQCASPASRSAPSSRRVVVTSP